MAKESETIEEAIRVEVIEHRDTHLLVALSKDLPGFMIAARSEAQIQRELLDAIREVLEAQGKRVISVTAEKDSLPNGFLRRALVANAKLARAA